MVTRSNPPASPIFPDPEELNDAALGGGRIDVPRFVDFFKRLNASLSREFNRRPPPTTPPSYVLLASPGGKIYKLVVSDAGVTSTILVYNPP